MPTPTTFGAWMELRPGLGRQPDPSFYAECLEEAALVEELGLAAVWGSEHHAVEDGHLSQQLPFLAAVAARTSRIQLGTGVLLLPLYRPRDVAEQAGVVDLIAGGRPALAAAVRPADLPRRHGRPRAGPGGTPGRRVVRAGALPLPAHRRPLRGAPVGAGARPPAGGGLPDRDRRAPAGQRRPRADLGHRAGARCRLPARSLQRLGDRPRPAAAAADRGGPAEALCRALRHRRRDRRRPDRAPGAPPVHARRAVDPPRWDQPRGRLREPRAGRPRGRPRLLRRRAGLARGLTTSGGAEAAPPREPRERDASPGRLRNRLPLGPPRCREAGAGCVRHAAERTVAGIDLAKGRRRVCRGSPGRGAPGGRNCGTRARLRQIEGIRQNSSVVPTAFQIVSSSSSGPLTP